MNQTLVSRFTEIQKGKLLSVSRYGDPLATFGVKKSQLHHQGNVKITGLHKSMNYAKRK